MKYSIKDIKDDSEFLFFWGHQPAKDGSISKTCLSQWWQSSFVVDGVEYLTAEHWMMARKAILFGDNIQLNNILKEINPAKIKEYGRAVENFDFEIWNAHCYQTVLEGNCHKFSQNESLKTYLLSTKEVVIVEASPFDKIWGIGTGSYITNPKEWNGQNLLGFALMEV